MLSGMLIVPASVERVSVLPGSVPERVEAGNSSVYVLTPVMAGSEITGSFDSLKSD
jgi:hypothetical protein